MKPCRGIQYLFYFPKNKFMLRKIELKLALNIQLLCQQQKKKEKRKTLMKLTLLIGFLIDLKDIDPLSVPRDCVGGHQPLWAAGHLRRGGDQRVQWAEHGGHGPPHIRGGGGGVQADGPVGAGLHTHTPPGCWTLWSFIFLVIFVKMIKACGT